MDKYKVTAYELRFVWEYKKNNELKASHRWVKISSWNEPTKEKAYKIANVWSKYRQPYFKATIQSLKKVKK